MPALRFLSRHATSALLVMVAVGGCAPAAATASPPPAPAGAPASATADTGHAALEAIVRARGDSARRRFTKADVDFMAGMIHHHAQAILMAEWAPTHGASASVRTLAARIINAQRDDIALMQRWLRDRGQPVPAATPGPMKMVMDGMEHDMLMPGMLTDAQLRELDAARGSAFDRLFLTYMIQHHRGAVSMVKELFGSYGAAQDDTVFKLASDVNVDQTTEIERMQKMLATLLIDGQLQ
ncbi:MAG TPA: DUF305 domain-containing protein [Gemmatimonadaceae bacterium]